jgi:uncharacterized repeat protein (TIGR01451 family)
MEVFVMMRSTSKLWVIVLISVAVVAATLAQSSGGLELISVSSEEVQGDNNSGSDGFANSPDNIRAGISELGNIVAFMSRAENLVPEDTNLVQDVFVRDRDTGITERVSVTSKGRQGDPDDFGQGGSGADISDDGNLVVFDTALMNLVRGDENANPDVYIHDRTTRTTQLVSLGLDGTPDTGERPVISGDGRFVAFTSRGQNLVADHPEFELRPHVYVYDVQTQSIERIDVDSNEVLAAGSALFVEINQDGRYVAFGSAAENLVSGPGDGGGSDVFVRDRGNGTTHGVTTGGDTGLFEGDSLLSSISPDGLRVGFSSEEAFDGDSNGFIEDAYVGEWQSGIVRLVSRDSAGNQGQGLSANSHSPLLSADPNSVIFTSRAALVADDSNVAHDVYRRDLATGITVRLAADDDGADVIASDITNDGRFVSLLTAADLLPHDVNFFQDVYVLNIATADVALTMADTPDPVVVRTNLTYTLTVQNNGPDAASGVTLTDPLSSDAVFVSATASQGTCTRAGSGSRNGLVTCAVGTISAGGAATVTIVVSPSRAGTLTNTATVRASSPDANLTNNSATETTTVRAR